MSPHATAGSVENRTIRRNLLAPSSFTEDMPMESPNSRPVSSQGPLSTDGSVSVEQLVARLTSSGLLDAEAIRGLVARIPPARRAHSRQLAEELVRQKVLTSYQAMMLCQRKSPGLVLGNYVILEKLGAGGMGQVFKAMHRRMERVVVLKLLPPEMTQSPVAVERFQREVKAAARLSHPNIVAAYDADEAGGVHFLIMEYVEGRDLKHVVQTEGPLTLAQAFSCVGQTARGLEHAHTAGVTHRDIKPANLLLGTDGIVKILDMGLARLSDKDSASRAVPQRDLTKLGNIVGTFHYMAPEQATGTNRIDNRVDIYSLGCTLYFLLTGKPPFEGDSMTEVLWAHLEKPIPSLATVCPGTSPALDAVFQRMLAKKADDRFATMTEVIAALKSCKAGLSSAKLLLPRRSRPQPSPTNDATFADVGESQPDFAVPKVAVVPRTQRRRLGIFWAGAGVLFVCLAAAIVYSIRTPSASLAAATQRHSPTRATEAPVSPTRKEPETGYLCDLPERDVTVGYGSFGKKGDLGYDNNRIVFKGVHSPHGLSMHPPERGSARVTYTLNKQYRTFRAMVAINDDIEISVTALVFKVSGDGKLLWQSKPLTKRGEGEECIVPVSMIERLELEVHCPGPCLAAHAVWIEPQLLK
jgi:serine/threonine protein kinase